MSINFKKLFASLGLFAIVFSTLTLSAFAADDPFPDVESDHENAKAIQFMKDNEVFQGYPDGTYKPDQVLNRAEQLKVYMLLHNIDPPASTYKNCFPDVGTDWYARFVCFAKEQNWIQGYPDGTFKPAQEVNKVEALKMLGEIEGWDAAEPDEDPYDDTPKGEWYAKYVAFAKNANLLMEDGDSFDPAGGLSRAATSEILYRTLAVYALEEDSYSDDLDDSIQALNLANIIPPANIVLSDAPDAEFGDAPDDSNAAYPAPFDSIDGMFPTLFNTTNSLYGPGAHALDSSMEYLGDPSIGEGYSYETDADDPADPDGDTNLVNEDGFDDGVNGLTVRLESIPPPASLSVDVTVESGAPDVPRYLNVLIDLNMDGKWKGFGAGGEPEWVVQNFVIDVDPGTTETITTDDFAYANGMALTPVSWMRVVLSRAPIDVSEFDNNGWDGSGVFEYGEVEDYYLQLPDWPDPDDPSGGSSGGGIGGPGKRGRGLVWGKPAPVMVCPKHLTFGEGVNAINFRCMIANYGGNGDADYDLWKISGGVAVLPVAGRIALATAPPGFPPFGVVGNPKFVRFWAFRGQTPSTWGYKVVGVDPESTVKDSIVDIGLVPADKDEGYSAVEGDGTYTAWSDELDDAYLFEDGYVKPVLFDATILELDNSLAPGEYSYQVIAHASDPNTNSNSLEYEFSSPAQCGMMTAQENVMEWTFSEADAPACMEGGLIITVSDGTYTDTLELTDIFTEDMIPEEVVNEEPLVETLMATWLNTMADDPHIYNLEVFAVDPEGGDMIYNWTDVTCGELIPPYDQSSVEWQYPKADIGTCVDAEVTVEITDDQDLTTTHTQPIFQ